MNIVHAIETLDPSHGGPTLSVPSLAAAQAGLGHDVTLVAYAEADPQPLRDSLPGFDKVRIAGVPRGGYKERLLASSAKQRFEEVTAGADVVHIHSLWRPFALVAAQTSIRRGLKLVVAPRGMLNPWSLQQRRLLKQLSLTLSWKRVLDAAFFIHALNDEEAQFMKPLELRSQVRVFPNGIFSQSFRQLPSAAQFRAKCGALGDRPYLLFLGRLHHVKGLDYLLAAYAEYCRQDSRMDLVIAGPDGGMEPALRRQVSELRLDSRVHLVGPLYGADKYSALAGATCFCLTSRQEGFSMAITEALACGVPVVVSDQCHFPEIATAGAGEVVPLDSNEIAAALLRLTSSTQRLRRASEAARSLVSRYDWSAIASDVVGSYNTAAAV
ncbi:MAG: glycosyltransferase [Pseudomonadota bacterium]|nr:glycosyltransferase [Pseudomonadota bacterium]